METTLFSTGGLTTWQELAERVCNTGISDR
jgi:hypothetical protein